MQCLVEDPEATPSARILSELQQTGSGFFDYALGMARSHRDYFASIAKPNEDALAEFQQEAQESLQRQAEIEASDSVDLDKYLERYFR